MVELTLKNEFTIDKFCNFYGGYSVDKRLLIVGAGQFGQMVKEIALEMKEFSLVDFLDDMNPLAVGKIEELPNFVDKYEFAICAIGNSETRKRITERIVECGYKLASVISPYAYVSSSAVLGDGVIIEPMSTIQKGVRVGNCSIVSSGTVLRHDCCVGSVCQVDCGSVVMSNMSVPNGTKIECLTVFKNN